ncbi:hypothetical protein EMPS_09325 [Entomortierella parvispora]|uniref:DUF2439 domain-containing protein n=1 Tax=Entomortierella parvispora TaxID=205924 RepID=A0A9P3HI14_9FUNG|nr:hypothetical protein EMPS_09325 [Entomortierella parvispora]
MNPNPYSEFTCLYTSQKLKKAKTWQDGHIRYFHNNSKVVLYDVKFVVLDSSFHRGATIAAGDDLDMDRHLITIENLTMAYATNSGDQLKLANRTTHQPTTISRKPIPPQGVVQASRSFGTGLSIPTPTMNIPDRTSKVCPPTLSGNDPLTKAPQPTTIRKKWRPPFSDRSNSVASGLDDDDLTFDEDFGYDSEPASDLNANGSRSTSNHNQANVSSTVVAQPSREPASAPPAPKRRRVGLSKGPSTVNIQGQGALISPHRPPSTQLEFPNAARCVNFSGKNSSQLLRRTISLPSRFTSTSQYKEGLAYLIYEHLQILVIEIAMSMWSVKNNSTLKEGDSFDALYRGRGIHMHSGTTLRRRGDPYSGFPMFSGRSDRAGAGQPTVVQIAQQQGAVLSITNKEHHSKYSKDDLWVVSKTSRFESSSTFFARSVFYGPSGSDIEVVCLSAKDSSIAREMFANSTGVCAIRLLNGMSEFMMIDNLENLMRTPILPTILNYVPSELVKASKTSVFKVPSRVPEKSGCIVLTEDDGIDVEMEVRDTVGKYNLNEGQATVLRNFALTVIRAPGWGDKSDPPPILLVHGVFGAGKSFLIAVLIVFVNTILNKARPLPREERSCRFLVTSMTNVAVDRILMALLDLNYTNFVRVGSLKKVAKRVLPFTAQSNTGRGEDIKELQSILDDDSISIAERRYVKEAMKRFTKHQNRGIVEGADVVGATCNASTFEVLDDTTFPIVILDEASQLLEPMSLIPICRAAGEKLILVGDPLQLSPPLNTNSDTTTANKGLSRTLFDRSIEMGIKPLMLKTQYRCHQRIANISNTLFYSNNLTTGTSLLDRAPLIEGLPTLTFIDNMGQEIQNVKTKSFTNPAEIKLVVKLVQRLLVLNVPGTSIGVISLYKSQADSIQQELSESLKSTGYKGAVQISTVDAFQGSEKDIIIVSTVRTDSIGFTDNHQRVNVALTRSKRHLFIVGNTQLLSTNRLWGSIINDHCGPEPDGIMHGHAFVRRLLSLQPLPKVVSESRLQESEDEDGEEEEDEDEEEMDAYSHEDDDHGHDEEEDAFYYRSGSKPTASISGQSAPKVVPRSYALYATDDDGSDSEDEPMNSRARTLSGKSAGPPIHKTRSPYIPKGDHGTDVTGSDRIEDQRHGPANSVSTALYGAEVQRYGRVNLPPHFVDPRYGQASPALAVAYNTAARIHDQAKPEEVETPRALQPKYNLEVSAESAATEALRLNELTMNRRDNGESEPIAQTIRNFQDDRLDPGTPTISTSSWVGSSSVKVESMLHETQYGRGMNAEEQDTKGPEKTEEVIWEMDEDEDDHSSSHQLNYPTTSTASESQRVEDLYVEGFSQMPAVGGTVSSVNAQGPASTVSRPQTCPPADASRPRLSTGDEEDDILCLEVGDLDAF